MFREKLSDAWERARWWYAKRFGERPQCSECSRDAYWYTSDKGYLCMFCEDPMEPAYRDPPVGFIRDLEPEDYLDEKRNGE